MNKNLFFLLPALIISNFCSAQIITTIAGTGENGFSGDGGPAVNAKMRDVGGVILDKKGNIYFGERSEVVRKINTAGIISTIAGPGSITGYGGDGGPATSALLNTPSGPVFDDTGNIYIADAGNYVIRKIDTFGVINTIAGNHTLGYSGDGLPATDAQLGAITSLTIDSSGNLYIVDYQYNNIRKITPAGIITTFAGTGVAGYNGDGIAASTAQLNIPLGIAIDKHGNIFVTDGGNNRIRKINGAGVISTIAGTGTVGYTGDNGPATTAAITGAAAIAIDSAGNIIFSEGTNRIRKINTSGIITTIAGSGVSGYGGDGGHPLGAKFSMVSGLAFDKIGNIYIADAQNYRVRMIRYNVNINDLVSESDLHTFPNPLTGNSPLHITRVSDEPLHVTITNTIGETIKELSTSSKKIELTLDVPDGLYYLQATTTNAQYLQKLMVQH